jgi:hypothetical protein
MKLSPEEEALLYGSEGDGAVTDETASDSAQVPQEEMPRQTTGVRPADAIMKRLHSVSLPEPKVDQDKLDRLQRMGRINNLGRGVGVLGNILSLGLGGDVAKADPDTMTPSLVKEYENTLDRLKAQKDAYDLRDFQHKMDMGKLEYGDALSTERSNTADQRYKEGLEEKGKDRTSRENMHQKSLDATNKRTDLEGEQLKSDKEYKKGMLGYYNKMADAANIKANKTGSGKPYHTVVVNGQSLPMDRGQYNDLYARMIADKGFASKNFRVKMSDYANSPRQGMDVDIAKYSQYNPQAVKEVLEGTDPIEEANIPGITTNASQPKPTISTGGLY